MFRLSSQRLLVLLALLISFVLAVYRWAGEGSIAQADDGAARESPQSRTVTKPPTIDHAFVAGFDRFFADEKAVKKSNTVAGGLLLLGELNCTSCHAAEGPAGMQIDAKQAPLLGEVAARANPKYLRKFIADPHGTKPGTTMPNLLAGVRADEAQLTAEAIAHYLASIATSPFRATGPDMSAIVRGEELFHKVGCVACHAPRREPAWPPGTSAAAAVEAEDDKPPLHLDLASVPLSRKLHEKYNIAGLAQFLVDPLRVRPSGRMPRLNLTQPEAIDIASYLVRDTQASSNLRITYYEGDWDHLPDFDKLTPKSSGGTKNFTLGPLANRSNYAVRFDGFLNIVTAGDYSFFLSSDDGSRLEIDGKVLIDHDGVHGGDEKTGTVTLATGLHPIRVAFFQAQGGAELDVSYQGPRVRRQRIPPSVLTATEKPVPGEEPFNVDVALAAKGREAFVSVGCASCHQLTDSPSEKVHKLSAPPLVALRADAGCLSSLPANGRPHYVLNAAQRRAMSAAIGAIQQNKLATRSTHEQISATMTALNCYACHKRDETGGVIRERDPYFTANSPDLGDEGRIPPLLTGVGDKLRPESLQAVLTKAAVARPYMDARMPQVGEHNLHEVAKLFAAADHTNDKLPDVADSPLEAKKAGFALVGKEGLTCISCHMFNRHKSLGIQAMDLTLMHERLRPEWFHKYMLNPPAYRPGTRMPQAFLNGKSTKDDVFGGNADRQINAFWQYLADGRRAKSPEGLVPQGMELIVGAEALVYRGFIEGAGPRGIAVGYPEEVNVAFDASAVRPAMIWQGRFFDASKHWSGRGEGFQPPAGDDVRKLPPGAPFALLTDEQQPWPIAVGKKADYHFRGYHLDELRRPTFLYDLGDVHVEDFFTASGLGKERHLVRTIHVAVRDTSKAPANLYHRAAVQSAPIDVAADGAYRLEDKVTLRFPNGESNKSIVRAIAGRHELLIPIVFKDGKAEVAIEYHW